MTLNATVTLGPAGSSCTRNRRDKTTLTARRWRSSSAWPQSSSAHRRCHRRKKWDRLRQAVVQKRADTGCSAVPRPPRAVASLLQALALLPCRRAAWLQPCSTPFFSSFSLYLFGLASCQTGKQLTRLLTLEYNWQFEILPVNKVAVFEQQRRDRRRHHRVLFRIELTKRGRHWTEGGRQRLHECGKGRPIDIQRRELVADEERAAFGFLLLQPRAEEPYDLRHAGGRRLSRLRTVAILRPELEPERPRRVVGLGVGHGSMNHCQSFRPGETVLAADFVAIPEHERPILNGRWNQRRIGLQPLRQIELLDPRGPWTLVVPNRHRTAALPGPFAQIL